MDDRIDTYIRENRARYTRAAIRQQLVAAGHDPTAIDQALANIRPESAGSQSRVRTTSERLQSGWAIFLYLLGFSAPIGLAVWTFLYGTVLLVWLLLFLIFYAVAGYFLVRWVTRSVAPAGPIDLIRFFIALPFLFALLLGVGFFATCIAAYRLS